MLWFVFWYCYFLCPFTWEARPKPSLSLDNTGIIVIDVNKVGTCNASWNQLKVLRFKNNIVSKYSRTWDADLIVATPVLKITNAIVKLTMCRGGVSFNTCEYFGTYRFGDKACEMIKDQNALWTPLAKALTPEARCPIKANTVYSLRNGTVNIDLLRALRFPIRDIIWKGEGSVANEEGKNWGCGFLELKASNFIDHH